MQYLRHLQWHIDLDTSIEKLYYTSKLPHPSYCAGEFLRRDKR
jgi:hypothetical protein